MAQEFHPKMDLPLCGYENVSFELQPPPAGSSARIQAPLPQEINTWRYGFDAATRQRNRRRRLAITAPSTGIYTAHSPYFLDRENERRPPHDPPAAVDSLGGSSSPLGANSSTETSTETAESAETAQTAETSSAQAGIGRIRRTWLNHYPQADPAGSGETSPTAPPPLIHTDAGQPIPLPYPTLINYYKAISRQQEDSRAGFLGNHDPHSIREDETRDAQYDDGDEDDDPFHLGVNASWAPYFMNDQPHAGAFRPKQVIPVFGSSPHTRPDRVLSINMVGDAEPLAVPARQDNNGNRWGTMPATWDGIPVVQFPSADETEAGPVAGPVGGGDDVDVEEVHLVEDDDVMETNENGEDGEPIDLEFEDQDVDVPDDVDADADDEDNGAYSERERARERDDDDPVSSDDEAPPGISLSEFNVARGRYNDWNRVVIGLEMSRCLQHRNHFETAATNLYTILHYLVPHADELGLMNHPGSISSRIPVSLDEKQSFWQKIMDLTRWTLYQQLFSAELVLNGRPSAVPQAHNNTSTSLSGQPFRHPVSRPEDWWPFGRRVDDDWVSIMTTHFPGLQPEAMDVLNAPDSDDEDQDDDDQDGGTSVGLDTGTDASSSSTGHGVGLGIGVVGGARPPSPATTIASSVASEPASTPRKCNIISEITMRNLSAVLTKVFEEFYGEPLAPPIHGNEVLIPKADFQQVLHFCCNKFQSLLGYAHILPDSVLQYRRQERSTGRRYVHPIEEFSVPA